MGIKKSRSPGRPMAPSITTTPAADETDLNQNSQHNQISGVDLVADSKSNTNTNINISTLRSASSTQLGRGREVVNTYQSLSTAVRVPFRSRSSLPNLVGASGSSAPSTAPAGTSIAEMTSGSSYGSVHNTTSTSRGGGGQDRRYYGHGESSSLLRGGYPQADKYLSTRDAYHTRPHRNRYHGNHRERQPTYRPSATLNDAVQSLSTTTEMSYTYNEDAMSHELAQKSHNRRFTERIAFHHVVSKGLYANGRLRTDSVDSGSESDSTSIYNAPGVLEEKTWKERIMDVIYRLKFSSSTLLLILGIISAMLDYFTNRVVDCIRGWRAHIHDSIPNSGWQFVAWVIFGTILAWSGIFMTRRVAPVAAGSGIPEMKVILAGATINNFFAPKTIAVKVVGLVFMLSANLSIGKEGPFVHTSAGLAAMTMKLPGFQYLLKDKRALHQITAAVCSVGVSSTFGAPFAGVLFSIEVMTEYYMVSTYWKAFLAATCGAVSVHYFRPYPYIPSYKDASMITWLLPDMSFLGLGTADAMNDTTTKKHIDLLQYNFFEFAFFIIIGLSCGLLGGGFVRLHEHLVSYRKWYLSPRAKVAFPYVVSLLVLVALYAPGAYMYNPINKTMGDFMYQGDLWQLADTAWGETQGMVYKRLFGFLVLHWLVTPICITLPAPTGVYLPLLGMGAAIGRLFGELIHTKFPSIHRGGYAVVGAAAMGGGGTRTISSAMVLCEVTGAVEFLLPALTATIIAISIGNRLSRSIYDSILYTKGLPYLPRLSRLPVNKNKTAHEVMRKDMIVIPQKMSWGDMARILLDEKKIKGSYPLVDDLRNMRLYGAVSRESLEVALYGFSSTIFSADRMKGCEPPPPVGSPCASPALRRSHRRNSPSAHSQSLTAALDEEDLSGNIFDLGITEEDIKVMERHFLDVFTLPDLLIDPSPFQVVHLSPLSEVHFMFIMLRCSHLFVTRFGRLIGYIMLKDLMHNDQNTRHKIKTVDTQPALPK